MIKVEKDEIELAINFFINNVLDINIHKYFFPSEENYFEKMYYLYKFYCNYNFNELFISNDGNSYIICHPPSKKMVTPTLKEVYSLSYLPNIGMKEVVRIISFQLWLVKFKNTILPKLHYYLDSFSLKGDFFNNPAADEVLYTIINQSKESGHNIFTEVYDENLISLFEAYNFKVVKEAFIPNSNVKAYCLVF